MVRPMSVGFRRRFVFATVLLAGGLGVWVFLQAGDFATPGESAAAESQSEPSEEAGARFETPPDNSARRVANQPEHVADSITLKVLQRTDRKPIAGAMAFLSADRCAWVELEASDADGRIHVPASRGHRWALVSAKSCF